MSDVTLDGIFIAKVLNNIDPLARERVFVRVLGVHDISDGFKDKTFGIWCDHKTASKYHAGDIPDIDDEVTMEFKTNNGIRNPNSGWWSGVVLKNNIEV